MYRLMRIACAIVVATGMDLSAHGGLICIGDSANVRVNTSLPTTVNKTLTIYVSPWGGAGESVSVAVDGDCLFSTTNQAEMAWGWHPFRRAESWGWDSFRR